MLKHQRVDVNQRVLQEVQRQHRQFLILLSVGRDLTAFAKRDEVVDAVPMLDDVEALLDLAPQCRKAQVATEEDCPARFSQFRQCLVGRMLQVVASEASQDRLGMPEYAQRATPRPARRAGRRQTRRYAERLPLLDALLASTRTCYLLHPGYTGPVPTDAPLYVPRAIAQGYADLPGAIIAVGPGRVA